MSYIGSIFSLVRNLVFFYWSLNLIDILPLAITQNINILESVDNIIKVMFAFVGLIFLIITLPMRYKNMKLKREIAKEELEKLKWENEKLEADNYKKINKIT